MSTSSSRLAATFAIGGDLEVNRLGFGAMRIVGPGVWGPPTDREAALAVVRRTRELGIDFIDTADSYGPYISEELIREALHPYGATRVATKAGLVRPGPASGLPPVCGRPDYLRQELEMSRRRLGVETLDLWQLHRIDPLVPADEQFGVLKEAVDTGKARHVGLSGVTVEELKAACAIVPIATVQNRYNLADRADEDMLGFCEREGIGFIPFFPLAAGQLAAKAGPLAEVADRHHATPGQIALAWLLHRSPAILPIPGTGSVQHLEENVAAASIELTNNELAALSAAAF